MLNGLKLGAKDIACNGYTQNAERYILIALYKITEFLR